MAKGNLKNISLKYYQCIYYGIHKLKCPIHFKECPFVLQLSSDSLGFLWKFWYPEKIQLPAKILLRKLHFFMSTKTNTVTVFKVFVIYKLV